MKKTLKLMLSLVAALAFVVSGYAQFTTSTMTGRVLDDAGEPLTGAAVVAVHTPSGSQYYAVANSDGYYTIPGMRPGGPYEVKVSFVGCNTVVFEDITLSLGETYNRNVTLKTSESIEEAVLVVSASKFDIEKTGASTNVSNAEMMSLPNASHSMVSLTKLSPYSNGMSFAGGDGRSTNFTVDGANFNNNFGLTPNPPGGGTPISLDAIEEIQLVVAPFDVRQSNFVGGGINAVTKSGTNTWKGTVYGNYYDQSLRGNKIAGVDLGERAEESNKIYGFTLGGPIIKNKLFFFVNYESQKMPEQTIKYQPDDASKTVLEQIKKKLVDDYGYDPGSYTNFPGGIENTKMLARIDWNITDAHHLTLRYNKTVNEQWNAPNPNSCDDSFRNKSTARSSETSFPFSNNMYSQNNNVNSFALELNSRFGDNVTNRFLATYTNIDDQRGTKSSAFPHIDIATGDTSGKALKPFTSFGYELFSWNNGVKNKSYQIQDNVNYYLGAHTLTAGASLEHMNALNSYMRNGAGYYRFLTVDDFLHGKTPLSYCLTYGYDGNLNPAGEVDYNQYAVYAQDEWKVNENLKLTYGIRADVVAFDDSCIATNPNIAALDFGGRTVDTGKYPDTGIQISPRFGFNWDVKGDKSLVLRGGTGLFQGRLPLVFFTNMPQYSGMIQGGWNQSAKFADDGTITYTPAVLANLNKLYKDGKFITDIKEVQTLFNLPQSATAESAGYGSQNYISGVDPDFKMPQIWKTSLAVDAVIPVGFPFTVTAEGIFNKTIWGICMEDWDLNDKALAASTFAGPDNRVNYRGVAQYNNRHTYVMTNTNKGWGYTANITVNMEPVKNLKLMAAYTHTESKELTGMPGSAANSVYTGIPTVSGPNFTGLQRSQYVLPDKVIASVSYFIPWKVFGGKGLHLNAFYSAYSSYGNSYLYTNDMNGDGNATDLIYIPASKDEIAWKTAADADAFWTFVNNDKYLSKHKGEYAEAYAARAPWMHIIDLRIAEDFAFKIGGTSHNFQISASIENFGNMLNSKWGTRKMSVYQNSLNGTIAPLTYEGINADGKPYFSMAKVNGEYPTKNYTKTYSITDECWRVMFGIKYFFN